MALEKKYVRDFDHKIIGSVIAGFDNGHGSVVRDSRDHVLGRTSTRFNETRDRNGQIVSSNTADAGLLLSKR